MFRKVDTRLFKAASNDMLMITSLLTMLSFLYHVVFRVKLVCLYMDTTATLGHLALLLLQDNI